MHRTVYVPPPFIPILLVRKLIPVKAWQRLWGDLVTANLEAEFWAVLDWLQFALVRSALNFFSHLLMYERTTPLTDSVPLKHRHAVLAWDLPGLNSSLSRSTGYLIATNIRDLVTDKRAARLEEDTLQR